MTIPNSRPSEAHRPSLRAMKETVSAYETGVDLVENGNYAEALQLLDQILLLDSRDYLSWTMRGAVLVYLGQYELAIASCDRALVLCPHHSEAWKFRGLALHGLNRYREAYESYDRALGIVRRSPLRRLRQWLQQSCSSAPNLTEQQAWF